MLLFLHTCLHLLSIGVKNLYNGTSRSILMTLMNGILLKLSVSTQDVFARTEKQKYITFKVKTNTLKGEQVFTRAEGLSSIIIDISSFTKLVCFVVSFYIYIVYVNVQESLKYSIGYDKIICSSRVYRKTLQN